MAWRGLSALTAALIVMLPSLAGAMKDTASLTVVVQKLRNDSGSVHVGLWDRAEGFGDGDLTRATRIAPAADGEQQIEFEGLQPGRYALAVYHDENDNGSFDRTVIGLPAEGLGFSNGAWIKAFGPPSFDDAAIEVANGRNATVIELRY